MPTAAFDFPFSGALDEKTQRELVDPPGVTVRANLVQTKTGALQKPLDLTVFHTWSGNSYRAISHRGEFLTVQTIAGGTDRRLNTHSAAAAGGAGPVADAGQLPEPRHQRVPIAGPQNGANPVSWDMAYANGYMIVAAALSDGSTWVWQVDSANGAILNATQLVGAAAGSGIVKVIAFGTTVHLFSGGTNVSAANILGWYNDLSTTNGWVSFTVATDRAASSVVWDVCALSDRSAIVYFNNSGGTSCATIKTYGATGTVLASTTHSVGATTLGAVGIGGATGDTLWVLYQNTAAVNNNVNMFALNPATLASLSGVNVAFYTSAPVIPLSLGVVVTAPSACSVAVSFQNTGSSGSVTAQTIIGTATIAAGTITVGTTTVIPRLRVEIRPFVQNGVVYIGVAPVSGSDPQTVSANGGQAGANLWIIAIGTNGVNASFPYRCVANIIPRLYSPVWLSPPPPGQAMQAPTHVAQMSANKIAIAYRLVQTSQSAGLELATLDWTPTNQWSGAAYGETLVVAGATPQVYDGSKVFEAGIVAPPEVWKEGLVAGTLTGNYAWTAIYEHFDGRSWVAYSEPAAPLVLNVSATGMNIRIANFAITQRQGLRSVLYRTKAGGSEFFRVGGSEQAVTSADHLDFADIVTDAQLGAPLYTQPLITNSALPRQSPPPFLHTVKHLDRVIGLSHPQTIWPSSQLVQGEEPWWHDRTQIPVPSRLACTALASMDGRLIVFTPEEIGYIDGQGPADNGTGNDYTPVAFIPTDIGCVDWRSLCVTRLGCFFQSRRGIELLNRSMQVENFFGRAVEDELAAFPIITSAVLNEVESRVYFTCVDVDGAPTVGRIIIFDMVHGSWSTKDPVAPIAGACIVGNDPTQSAQYSVVFAQPLSAFATSWGTAKQSATSYLGSTGAYASSTLETAWLKLAGLQGYWRARTLYLLAKSLTPHNITVQIAFDYEDTYTQTATFTAAQIQAFVTGREQFQIDLLRQKVEAIRVKITDATPSGGPAVGTGQGPALLGLRIEYDPKRRSYRLPAAQGV